MSTRNVEEIAAEIRHKVKLRMIQLGYVNLFRGLLEALPEDGKWTQQEHDAWLMVMGELIDWLIDVLEPQEQPNIATPSGGQGREAPEC